MASSPSGATARSRRLSLRRRPLAAVVCAALVALLVGTMGLGSRSAAAAPQPRHPIPLLAYYYIWFDPSSWNRAKSDLPVLGPYSSDDETVMRRHIQEAKSAGIEGFIVSWKSTTVLDRRLATLIQVARDEDFKLAIIYQGLDFSREPLPATQIADDLDYFIAHFASDPVFDSFGKPLVIWSGTWRFSEADIGAVAGPRRDRLQILASEQTVGGFERVADLVDGNAYYWSSVNPDTYPDYPGKLAAMGAAVHDNGGLWISPAAPGFDARLLGHPTVVDRQGGKMLERQLDASIRSFPDAIGLISWNEFSENSYVEPSRKYGTALPARSRRHPRNQGRSRDPRFQLRRGARRPEPLRNDRVGWDLRARGCLLRGAPPATPVRAGPTGSSRDFLTRLIAH